MQLDCTEHQKTTVQRRAVKFFLSKIKGDNMNKRKIIENLNYAHSLLCTIGEQENEITENLHDTIRELEYKWKKELAIQDAKEE
jgi:hypothetical protein